MRVRLLLSMLALIPLGCALSTEPQPDGNSARRLDVGSQVIFHAERTEYRQGETAEVTLRNGTDQPLGYNLCLSARERGGNGQWVRFEPLRLCTDVLHTLAPGAETSLQEPITAEWQPGEYRIVTTVERMRSGARAEVFTPPFTVRP